MSAVTVQYLKYPDTPHWRHDMVHLGDDDHGIWLGGPTGTTFQKGYEPEQQSDGPFVQLIPHEAWWSLIYNGEEGRFRTYVDITTPACWTGETRAEMVDLDLDVVLKQDGTIEVHDRDEFELHQQQLGYPKRLIAQALRAVEEVERALYQAVEPFGEAAMPWFERVR